MNDTENKRFDTTTETESRVIHENPNDHGHNEGEEENEYHQHHPRKRRKRSTVTEDDMLSRTRQLTPVKPYLFSRNSEMGNGRSFLIPEFDSAYKDRGLIGMDSHGKEYRVSLPPPAPSSSSSSRVRMEGDMRGFENDSNSFIPSASSPQNNEQRFEAEGINQQNPTDQTQFFPDPSESSTYQNRRTWQESFIPPNPNNNKTHSNPSPVFTSAFHSNSSNSPSKNSTFFPTSTYRSFASEFTYPNTKHVPGKQTTADFHLERRNETAAKRDVNTHAASTHSLLDECGFGSNSAIPFRGGYHGDSLQQAGNLGIMSASSFSKTSGPAGGEEVFEIMDSGLGASELGGGVAREGGLATPQAQMMPDVSSTPVPLHPRPVLGNNDFSSPVGEDLDHRLRVRHASEQERETTLEDGRIGASLTSNPGYDARTQDTRDCQLVPDELGLTPFQGFSSTDEGILDMDDPYWNHLAGELYDYTDPTGELAPSPVAVPAATTTTDLASPFFHGNTGSQRRPAGTVASAQVSGPAVVASASSNSSTAVSSEATPAPETTSAESRGSKAFASSHSQPQDTIPATTDNSQTSIQNNNNAPPNLKDTLDALFPHRAEMKYPRAPVIPNNWESRNFRHRPSVPEAANPYPSRPFEGIFNETQGRREFMVFKSNLMTHLPAIIQANANIQGVLNLRNTTPFLPPMALPFRPSVAGPEPLVGNQVGGAAVFPLGSWTNIKGLRENLLLHGRMGNQSRIELKDLTFYDHTPPEQQVNSKTSLNTHTNHFVVNYAGADMKVGGKTIDVGRGGSGAGQRCVMYQVDIPIAPGSPESKRWIYFLISRPLLSMANITVPGTRTFQKQEYQPLPSSSNIPQDFVDIATSSSWVVFAAPMECVREMGTSKETPFWDIAEEDKGKVEGRKVEFQFSFWGVPSFEFSEKEAVEERLVARGILDEDASRVMGQGEWLAVSEARELIRKGGDESSSSSSNSYHNANYENENAWFQHFQGLKFQDALRWLHIREMMARGSCRIVARYEERKESSRGKRKMESGRRSGGLSLGCFS